MDSEYLLKLRVVGRETFLVKVIWENDWPVFNGGKNITIATEGRHTGQLAPAKVWNADLSKQALELGWYQKREFNSSLTMQCPFLTPNYRHAIEAGVVIVRKTRPSSRIW